MTTPAIRAIREYVPSSSITLLTSPSGAAVASMVPEIDEFLIYEAPWMKATGRRESSGPEFDLASRLRRLSFDAAVIFTVYSQSPLPAALLCYMADIPLRLAHCRENPYQLLTDWVPETEPQQGIRHECRRHLDLVASVGFHATDARMSLRPDPEVCARVRKLLQECGVWGEGPWAVIHPGASAPSRRYPPELFAAACRALVVEQGWRIVFTGSAEEASLVEEILRTMNAPGVSLAGRLGVDGLTALLSFAPLLISNNTGPVHIAAALGTPVVDLYALTNPQHTPWRVPNRVLSFDVPCKYCYKSICPEGHNDCLRRIAPSEVVQAALDLYRETRQGALKKELLADA